MAHFPPTPTHRLIILPIRGIEITVMEMGGAQVVQITEAESDDFSMSSVNSVLNPNDPG